MKMGAATLRVRGATGGVPVLGRMVRPLARTSDLLLELASLGVNIEQLLFVDVVSDYRFLALLLLSGILLCLFLRCLHLTHLRLEIAYDVAPRLAHQHRVVKFLDHPDHERVLAASNGDSAEITYVAGHLIKLLRVECVLRVLLYCY